MNNPYRSFEQHLTPKVAQELIRELFAGQTVQRQEIVRTVDERHRESGGQPSRATGAHPVTRALSAMKMSGLAENPRWGFWYILPEGECHITTLNEFMEWLKQFSPAGDYVFRGVPNQEYGIEASAYRRPKKEDRNFQEFLKINLDLIDEAKLRGYNERNGLELKDLEILAELQHFGAATCLIDFTHNALVALWFACQPDSKIPQDSPPPNGKVFAVRNQPPDFTEINSDLLTREIKEFLIDGEITRLYHWRPRQQNNRIIAQQSIFLFGYYKFDAKEECVILESSKQDILTELAQVSGITEAMLFPDFDGFARLRGEGKPYTQPSASEYIELANERFQRSEYDEAITYCNWAIDRDSGCAQAYYLRGLAKHYLQQYEPAISDFDLSIKLNPDYQAYYYRAEANYRLDRFAEARADLQNALPLAEEARDEEFVAKIADLFYEIDSRTAGGAQDE